VSITSYNIMPMDKVVVVEVVSSLSGTVFFHWYLDGLYMGVTTASSRAFWIDAGEQARVEVLDTTDPAFDPIANAPDAWPARRLLWWVRSLDADVDHYRVEERKAAGAWELVSTVRHVSDRWHYSAVSRRLDDLTDYTWRIVPVDRAGNQGTVQTIGPEKIVRRPDAPDFEITFNSGPQTITFSEAA